VKIDTQLARVPADRVAEEARRAEATGFDGLWTVEAGCDPFLPLIQAASATRELELGTSIAVAFGRSPLSMAQVAWDLQRASGGRMRLGLGTQVRAHVERRYSMPFEHPAARITDYVRCVRAIWNCFQTGATPSYQGRFYQFTLMNPMFSGGPIDRPDIPIYLAGVNPRMCRAAGEVADGFHVHPMHSVGYLRDVVMPALDEGAKLRGKRGTDLELYAPIFVVTGETRQERDRSEASVRRQISFYGSTPSYRTLLEYHDLGALGRELSQRARRGDWEEMPKLIPDELVEQIAVIASPAELPATLRRRYDGILARLSLYFPISSGDADERTRAFIQAFRAA